MLNDKAILITGGTGSFGKQFVATVLKRFPEVRRVVIYSRDELKQSEMQQQYPREQYPQLRFFIGDVRDEKRLWRGMEDVDVVVHAAALKHVPVCEYNPFEAIKTNVLGAQNVIEAAIDRGVKRVVALSTDKAAAPINLYGATKLASDKLFVAANRFKGSHDIRFCVVRYGNVMGSRGSVIPFFMRECETGVLPITDAQMTRFNITLDAGVSLVLHALEAMWGGEIFVPKIPSYKILDVAEAIAPRAEKRIVGIRPGEKLHEEMITETDALSAVEFDERFVIMPATPLWNVDEFVAAGGGKRCEPGFRYSSDTNTDWLTVDQLRDLIRANVDPGVRAQLSKTVRPEKPRVVCISQARMESTRLPGKVLADLGGAPVLRRVWDRLERASSLDEVVLALPDTAANDELAATCREWGARVFRGALDDVLARYLGAAAEARADVVVRVTSDCPFVDPDVVDAVVQRLLSDRSLDYASNNLRHEWPLGLDVEAVWFDVLARAAAEATAPGEREHVTPYVYNRASEFRLAYLEAPEWARRPDYRLTVDEADDLELARAIYAVLGADCRARGVVEYLDANPELTALNAHVAHKTVARPDSW